MLKLDLAEEMRAAPTPSEAAFWDAVKGGQMSAAGKPIRVNRQQVIRGFIADFYLPHYRTIIEVDGGYHQSDAQAARDERRDDRFSDWYYSVFRVSDKLVLRDVRLVREVVEWLAEELAEDAAGDRIRYSRRHWRLAGYGVLARGYSGRVKSREHVFRRTEAVPDSVQWTYTGELGEVDVHDYSECGPYKCREWSR